jgi:hypothetical protein
MACRMAFSAERTKKRGGHDMAEGLKMFYARHEHDKTIVLPQTLIRAAGKV